MERVGVLFADNLETGCLQLRRQLASAVDADVAARIGVVFGGQRPADRFAVPAGNADGEPAAGPEHTGDLGHRPVVVRNVLQDLGGDHVVEAGRGEGQRQGIALDQDARPLALAGLRHRRHPGPGQAEFLGAEVEGDHAGAPLERFEAVAAVARAEVEQAVAGANAKTLEVDRQQPAMTIRYCSTVASAARRQLKQVSARARPRSPRRRRRPASSSARPSAAASAAESPGGTRRPASPSGPTTSGSPPAVVATSGTAQAMASTAGSEKPSYSEGTTATSARA